MLISCYFSYSSPGMGSPTFWIKTHGISPLLPLLHFTESAAKGLFGLEGNWANLNHKVSPNCFWIQPPSPKNPTTKGHRTTATAGSPPWAWHIGQLDEEFLHRYHVTSTVSHSPRARMNRNPSRPKPKPQHLMLMQSKLPSYPSACLSHERLSWSGHLHQRSQQSPLAGSWWCCLGNSSGSKPHAATNHIFTRYITFDPHQSCRTRHHSPSLLESRAASFSFSNNYLSQEPSCANTDYGDLPRSSAFGNLNASLCGPDLPRVPQQLQALQVTCGPQTIPTKSSNCPKDHLPHVEPKMYQIPGDPPANRKKKQTKLNLDTSPSRIPALSVPAPIWKKTSWELRFEAMPPADRFRIQISSDVANFGFVFTKDTPTTCLWSESTFLPGAASLGHTCPHLTMPIFATSNGWSIVNRLRKSRSSFRTERLREDVDQVKSKLPPSFAVAEVHIWSAAKNVGFCLRKHRTKAS